MQQLRRQVTPIELLRHTMRSRLERNPVLTPDSQFEFLPRRQHVEPRVR
jgi:hypothetical protein